MRWPRQYRTLALIAAFALLPPVVLFLSVLGYLTESMRICLPFSLSRLSTTAHNNLSCQAIRPFANMSDTKLQTEDVQEGRLAGFLISQRDLFLQDLREGKGKGWTVVMGNEAGDLDSLASSIAFSQLSSTLLASRVVPLILTPPKFMPLRPENLLALRNASLPLSSLLHTNQLPIATSELAGQGVKFALVDHNRLLPQFGDGQVESVIDHHEDEGVHTDASIREITFPTGSCTSLVTKHFRGQWEASLSRGAPIPSELATLLLSGILIDTGGLKPGRKATPIDYEAAAFLHPISTLPQIGSNFSVSAVSAEAVPAPLSGLAETLSETKNDVSSLSTYELLMRDYKEYTWPTRAAAYPTLKVGLSTVPLGLKPWIAKAPEGWESLMEGVRVWMQERTLDLEGILTTYSSEKKGKHKRQLALIARAGGVLHTNEQAEQVFASLVKGLEASEELVLQEWKPEKAVKREVVGGEEVWVKVWVQGNAKATRKQVAPLLVSR
ncbi:hypothetical protein L202_07896 [Cryptococcus amylolentus CBS 6039]|uniref:DHHA2 domain-containing protein n=1 Tax=Cryptococcus amylolentus CBS 6039 TaxID=1295533 RepID=A0A1E3HC59_9TREE|nr:hypothetical protein L202_07896 [Cryptococcus amylolentus CBS 6039]ODN73356.1 hypothetical protein L202_07896 [Cryptococcus amylolentus CBS 6039]